MEDILTLKRKALAVSIEKARRLRADLCKQSLVHFAKTIEVPGAPANDDDEAETFLGIETPLAEHHILILEAAQRCIEKPMGRLMIFMPPGSAKSSYGSVVVPAWAMGTKPGFRMIGVSYGSDLARKMGRRTRSIVKQQVFREMLNTAISDESKAADEWALDNGSEYLGGGILSGLTGNRADLICIDDPIKGRREADSEAVRKSTLQAYEDDVKTRLKPNGSIIMIQTRWHEDDLAGAILPKGYSGESGMIECRDGQVWEVICLPAKSEHKDDPLGRKVGEYLWPEWFSRAHWAQFERSPRTWNALYQQRPAPEGGTLIKRHWWMKWTKAVPTCEYVLQSWDLAAEAGDDNDYSAMTTWGVFYPDGKQSAPGIILLDAWHGHLEFPELQAEILAAYRWKIMHHKEEKGEQPDRSYNVDACMVERKSAGHSMLQSLRRLRIPILPYDPKQDSKVQRVNAITPMIEAGMVYLPYVSDGSRARDFVEEFLAECDVFPRGKHDDYVDTLAQGLLTLRNRFLVSHPAEPEDEPEETVQRKAVYG